MLPFNSLEEAGISLGRNLTLAETLWFKYTAGKSDYILYCHNTLFLFIFYTLFPIPFVILELSRSQKIHQFKLQPKFNNSFSDMLECYRKVMFTFLYAVGPLQLLSYPVIKIRGDRGIDNFFPRPSLSAVHSAIISGFLSTVFQPLSSLEEAEICLGRHLTFAETLWFKYTAEQSDFILFCHNYLFFFILYTFIPMPFVILEFSKSQKIHKFKLQPNFNHASDMMQCYKKVVFTYLYPAAFVLLPSYPLIQWIGIRTSLPLPSRMEMVWQILVYFIVEDYANYWLHRMLHSKWGYEKIHRVHHEYTAPIGFAAPYAHWAEILVLGFASFLGPLTVPCHMLTFWLWFVLRQLEAIETHSGYEFPWSPSKLIPFYGGAVYHDYHHYVGGKSQSNFASVFTYCDYIYGTDKGYRYQRDVLKKATSQNEIKSA